MVRCAITVMSDALPAPDSRKLGENAGPEDFLPLVYDQLRRLAERHLRDEPNCITLQPTALVHEAYLRIASGSVRSQWQHRGHFFAAAATAMRRILVDRARQRRSVKGGGNFQRIEWEESITSSQGRRWDLIDLDDALSELEARRPDLAELVTLRFFAGLSMVEAAEVLGTSVRTAERNWKYAKAWLLTEITNYR